MANPTQTDTDPEIPRQAGIHGRVGRGYLARAFGLAVQMGQQFLIVPVFLSYWGTELYGDWLAILSIAGFVVLLEFGMRSYFGNELLQRWSRGDRDGFYRLLHQSLGTYAILLVIVLPILAVVLDRWAWTEIAGIREIPDFAAGSVLLWISVHMLAGLPVSVLTAVYRARGRQATEQVVTTLTLFSLVAVIAFGLLAGLGPIALAASHTVVTAIAAIGVVWHLKKSFADFRFAISLPRQQEFRLVAAKAPFFAAYPAAQALTLHGLIVVLSSLSTAGAAVVLFATTRTLVGLARVVPHTFGHVTGAELGRQFAQGDYDALDRLYRYFLRFNGCLFGGLVGLIAVIGPAFLEIWTLGKVPFEAHVFWLLLAAIAVTGPGEVGEMVQYYTNRPHGLALAFGVRGVVSVGVAAATIPYYGAAGAAGGLLAGNLLSHTLLLPIFAARLARFAVWRQHLIGYGTLLLAGAVSWLIAFASAELVGLGSLIQIVGVAVLWLALSTVPAMFIIFHRAQRRRIVDAIRKRLAS